MDDFINSMKAHSKLVDGLKESNMTEEATKMSLIIPFFKALGYDVFNPKEFVPEFTADIGTKKGEKVDYAIMKDGVPTILIEAKPITEDILRHESQLVRYFSVTNAKFGILTNGREYNFYTDLDKQNIMDPTPFFTVDFCKLKDNQIKELAKFQKKNYDEHNIFNTAEKLKYTNEIKKYLANQVENPSEDFILHILSNVYEGRKTHPVIEKFTGIVKDSLTQFINDTVNEKIQIAINPPEPPKRGGGGEPTGSTEQEPPQNEDVITTEEELEGYVTIKYSVKDIINPERIYYRDNHSYFNILIDDNIRKWVCRLYFNSSKKYIMFNEEIHEKYPLDKISDILQFRNKFENVIRSLIDVPKRELVQV